MESILVELAEQANENFRSDQTQRRKPLWEALFRGERPERPPVKCAPFMTGWMGPVWSRLIPEESLHFDGGVARLLEIQLRKKVYRFEHLRDDDVTTPTLWVAASPATPDDEVWGVKITSQRPAEAGGAYKPIPAIIEEADLERVELPQFRMDASAQQAMLDQARELVDGRVPVKVYDRQVGYSVYETAVVMRGAEQLMFDMYDRPEFVHRLMSRITDGIIGYHKQREAAGAFDAEEAMRLHQPWDVPHPGPTNLMSSSWAYLSAQSAASLGPAMYAEFVQPYLDRIASLFWKIYYHGCEDLGEKVDSIRDMPNLRHFHVSPWTDVRQVVPKLRGRKVAMEVHAHPTNVLFVWGPKQIRAEARRRMDEAEDVPFDYVLCDLQTLAGAEGKLQMWCDIAMAESLR